VNKPLILYGLLPIANNSLEVDGELAAPSSWDTSLSANGANEVTAGEAQSAGDGIPSLKSLRQSVSNVASAKAIAAQRFAVADYPLLDLVRDEGMELALAASLKPANQWAWEHADLRIRQYDATGTATVGTGALLTAPSDRRFDAAGPDWYLVVRAVELHADTAYIDVELRVDWASTWIAASYAYWDRVLCGGLVDLQKGFRGGQSHQQDSGFEVNHGDGVAEIVRLSGPQTQIDADFRNVEPETPMDLQLKAFNRWVAHQQGFVALWGDRDYLTNRDRHFQRCYHDPKFKVDYPEGYVRRDYRFRFVAPSEGTA